MPKFHALTLAVAALALTVLCPVPSLAEQGNPVGNVIFYLDYSPSMNNDHAEWGENKMLMALNTLQALNQQIPDQGSTVAVYRFNEFKRFMPRTPYHKLALQGVLANIPDNYYEYDKFLRCTNVAKALREIEPVVKENAGTTSVIMITDGKDTAKMDPVAQAQALYEEFGDNFCLNFISLSDTAEGSALIAKLHAATGHGKDCGTVVTAKELETPETMTAFVSKAFSAN